MGGFVLRRELRHGDSQTLRHLAIGWECIAGDSVACALSYVTFVGIDQAQLGQRNICRRTLRAGTGGLVPSKSHLLAASPCMGVTGCKVTHALSDAFSSPFQENTTLLTSVRWRRRQRARHGRQSPFLHVCLDEDEPHLPKVHVHLARAISSDRREEVLGFQAVCDVLELLAVASEENRSRSRSVANTNDITLDVRRAVRVCGERLVEPTRAGGCVRNGSLVETCAKGQDVSFESDLHRTYQGDGKGDTAWW